MREMILLCVFSLCALLGIGASGRLQQRLKLLHELILEMQRAETLLVYRGLSPETAGESMERSSIWNALSRLLPKHETLDEAWEAAILDCSCRDRRYALLTAEEREALRAFGKALGQSANQEELQRQFQALCAELSRAEAELMGSFPQKSRIYRALGILGGIALVLVIW